MNAASSRMDTCEGTRLHPDMQILSLEAEAASLKVEIEGQIRYQSAGILQNYLIEQYRLHQPQSVVLDFRGIHFVDSQGLAVLFSLMRQCEPGGCKLKIEGARTPVRNLLKLTRVDTFIELA